MSAGWQAWASACCQGSPPSSRRRRVSHWRFTEIAYSLHHHADTGWWIERQYWLGPRESAAAQKIFDGLFFPNRNQVARALLEWRTAFLSSDAADNS